MWVCTAAHPSPGTLLWADSCPGTAWQQQPLPLQPVFPSEAEGLQLAGIYPELGCFAPATRRGASQCCAIGDWYENLPEVPPAPTFIYQLGISDPEWQRNAVYVLIILFYQYQ